MAVKNKYQDALFRRRKEQGLCKMCGEPLDREGTFCKKCCEKINKQNRETRAFYIEIGVCPMCRKNSLIGTEKLCKECAAKKAETAAKCRDKNRELYNKNHREYRKVIYRERKDAGICVRCGKRKAREGKAMCPICAKKDAEYHRTRYANTKHNVDVPRSERPDHGLCYICGAPIESGKICETCRKRLIKNLQKSKGNNYWRRDNKVAFAKWR